MRTIDELLEEVPALAGLTDGQLDLMAGCARNRVFAAGDHLLREGEPAKQFFAIRHGSVALETFVPQRGAVMIETLHGGDLVGWSWLFPPQLTVYDARALGVVRAVAFDGACLREKCEEDPQFGYELMKRFTGIIVERLQATRLRLLDVYGQVPGR
ncbi:MAG: cyclic nucleotide-binding domain-containing protein [Gaiellaceae bacterium]